MDISKIHPQGARVLIEAQGSPTHTASGLELSRPASEAAPVLGKVMRVGLESTYKVGQTVMFRRYSLDELKVKTSSGDLTFNLVEDSEIVAVISDE